MAWLPIVGLETWEYNDAPADPGGGQTELWLKQVDGIRTNTDTTEIYTETRLIGDTQEVPNEINRSYCNSQAGIYSLQFEAFKNSGFLGLF